ncbi:MAG: 16S rRNA (uracil(1498)-N(3))-methyltransferase [Ignavibacteria bacterium]|nr:16S rRNA (uracil(1498)-N(3))-methyltransferase [Ignavibacteria bacterium]
MSHFAGQELFRCNIGMEDGGNLVLTGSDIRHITKVMRHKAGDIIHVTSGDGIILKVEIISESDDLIKVMPLDKFECLNKLSNIEIAIPRLKNSDKIELVIEKLVETGFTKFVFFESDNCVGKGFKLDRWEKIAISASKQSFNPFTVELRSVSKFDELFKTGREVIGFDLEAENSFAGFQPERGVNYILVTGPEGGLSKKELAKFRKENLFQLTGNRLRSETAILYSAFLITRFF